MYRFELVMEDKAFIEKLGRKGERQTGKLTDCEVWVRSV